MSDHSGAVPMNRSWRGWRPVLCLLLLAAPLGCGIVKSYAKSNYEIIDTGITGGKCWVDDTHFLVEKRVPRPGSDETDLEGLYYLDPNQPKDLKRIDLAPITPSLQKRVRTALCQGQAIVFYVPSDESRFHQIYGLRIGAQPELIAEMRGGSINLDGRYVISKFRRPGILEEQGMQGIGIYEAHPDCGMKYVKPGFKELCLDTWMEGWWGGKNFGLTHYTWYEAIKVRDKMGQQRSVPNPEPPLKLADGTELKQGYLLRDLENQVLAQVKMEQPPHKIYKNTLKLNPQGDALYGACSKNGDHDARLLTVGGRICRFEVDGVNQHWTEVAAVQQSLQDPLSLQYLNVNQRGDVLALEPAHGGATMLWKYSATTHQVERVRQAPTLADLGSPQLSPSGKWISFVERRTLYLARDKGVKP